MTRRTANCGWHGKTRLPVFRTARRRGYVLVMTLALLVLCATMLVTVSRASLRHATAARSARDDLQRKWGAISCQRAVLEHAEHILATAEAERKKPVPILTTTLRLGAPEFELILADEQSKANVNAILANSDVPRTEARIREALAGSGLANDVKLRPTYGRIALPLPEAGQATTIDTGNTALAVDALGQIFDDVPPARLLRRSAGGKSAPAELLTCWGTGAINVRRAHEGALLLAAGRSLTRVEINRLIDARDALFAAKRIDNPAPETPEGQPRTPGERLRALMHETAAQSLKNRGNLGLLETSACHSVWIITRSPRREWYDLAVLDRSNPDRPATHTFSW